MRIAGPIVLQKSCQVLADDTPETLKVRVRALEREALAAALVTRQACLLV